ncbi:MAG: winged helix-turn-helix transcriptional regulator [Devosia sp.]|uniref:MarR family winged helix-turn-helix transcriptional regulator n=1 Tax=Devosia sp. TaxID=1871048 RepID=UPI0024C55142|nr:MarR family winged helix-turn-helix transcriptional regulator [Devosia sp.]UYO01241.1 MAG: winged helix-turn-helix transcriptional regulator [Devosia sp.]
MRPDPAPSAPSVSDVADGAIRSSATTGIVGYRLRRAQLNVFQQFLTAFEQMQLRPAEYSVLVLIDDNPGRKQTEIAEVLGIKRANLVTLVHGLEDRGLVERIPSAADKRANALHLTPAGDAFLARAKAIHDGLEQDIVARLGGPEVREHLLELLDRLS